MKVDKIKVSIITVCYNSADTIERTIQSVYDQTYGNIEYIIVDGQSTDGTLDIVEAYKEPFGDRLTIISEPDNGIYDAMNKGIRMATGSIIGLLNSDDFYENNAVSLIVSEYETDGHNEMAVYYGADRALIDGKEASITFHNAEFLDSSMISHPASFITKAAYDEMGLYDTQYSCVADYDLMLRYKHSKQVEFIPIYSVLTNFSVGGACSSQKAQIDLFNMKVNRGMVSKRSARWTLFLMNSSNIFRKILGLFGK